LGDDASFSDRSSTGKVRKEKHPYQNVVEEDVSEIVHDVVVDDEGEDSQNPRGDQVHREAAVVQNRSKGWPEA
jgi:hypothetical protein